MFFALTGSFDAAGNGVSREVAALLMVTLKRFSFIVWGAA